MRCLRVCMEVPLRRNYSVYTLSPNINSGFATVSAQAPGLYCTILERPQGATGNLFHFLYSRNHDRFGLSSLMTCSEILKYY